MTINFFRGGFDILTKAHISKRIYLIISNNFSVYNIRVHNTYLINNN